MPFYVDERAIVPRSFIAELLADGTIDAVAQPTARTRVLDLCTGNGSLAVLAAMAYPEVAVDAADISADALEVARINVDRHALQERIALVAVRRPGRPARPLRPDPVQPALRQRAEHGARCRPNTAPSRRWRWPAAPTAWTSSARCCATRPRA